MVFSMFAGLLVMAPSETKAALPSFLENGDIIIGSDYSQSTWTLNLNGGTHYMDGNLTIRAGGTVTISNGEFSFTQDCGADGRPGTADDHVYTLIVEDGGRLVLNNAVLSTHLDQIFDFPSLGVLVQNSGSIEATNSAFQFPGQIVVDDSSFTMTNSAILGKTDVAEFCNPSYFPEDTFSASAVLFAISSTCKLVNSRVDNMYEGIGQLASPAIYNYSYDFAADTGKKDAVTYALARHVNSFTPANTAVGSIANLTQDDQKYVEVGPSQTLS
ncbi:MAG TPA: hypothetical protein VLU38_07265, partial [Methanomassiliicoccales archaeon]|nr:hypothetical protein [Methanomassiliicoccales archaeon]